MNMGRSLHIQSVRFLLLMSLFTLQAAAFAQKPVERNYWITFTGLAGRDGEKYVLSAVKDQDPGALVSVAPSIQQAKVRTVTSLNEQQLATTLAPFGIVVLSVSISYPSLPQARSVDQHSLPGFPLFIDTGNPEVDAADYAARKQLWINAHPDLYPPSSTPDAPGVSK